MIGLENRAKDQNQTSIWQASSKLPGNLKTKNISFQKKCKAPWGH
jgi:hypothetical protein